MKIQYNRYIEIDLNERNVLIEAAGILCDIAGISIKIWEKGAIKRLYVNYKKSDGKQGRTFLNLNDDTDLTLDFAGQFLSASIDAIAEYLKVHAPVLEISESELGDDELQNEVRKAARIIAQKSREHSVEHGEAIGMANYWHYRQNLSSRACEIAWHGFLLKNPSIHLPARWKVNSVIAKNREAQKATD